MITTRNQSVPFLTPVSLSTYPVYYPFSSPPVPSILTIIHFLSPSFLHSSFNQIPLSFYPISLPILFIIPLHTSIPSLLTILSPPTICWFPVPRLPPSPSHLPLPLLLHSPFLQYSPHFSWHACPLIFQTM